MQKTIEVDENSQGKRLDIYLSEKFNELSRSRIKKLIEEEFILLNDKAQKPSTKLNLNDVITVKKFSDEKKEIISQNIALDIVYEDDDVLIINKPRGMVVHPANGNYENTLVNALLHYLGDNLSSVNGIERAGIVHRIDKDTSGLLLVAKNDKAHIHLAEQLKNHTITRKYTLICHGIIDETMTIETMIGRNPKNRLQMAVVKEGKYAHTTIKPIELFDKYTYAEAILKTGRTHQIRVHLKYINHPIVGDTTYSNYKENINGQLLHAGLLGFIHPTTQQYLEFTVKEPDIFIKELKKLRTKI
ncbi:pseudouridine synthase, RluA family [Peptoanaerobacter stomatis]|jgi:pseudouridine synthase, rluA family|uniref:Pseudouridine synthase n=1 Tax=Peptoanaerobacter stomatis TaxID=796937 RepID=J4WG95_9FIRM|nr:RluA family pseudouridine synthase [Peptoanaerobacter stomatis]EJU24236.1 pseudouridine synthase, RluA family [Peptoanaerobacter stomatis]NWO25213.1 RluA family pseudouridine synthase [Peptostreptococcaceae bacterium oral taxon 081]